MVRCAELISRKDTRRGRLVQFRNGRNRFGGSKNGGLREIGGPAIPLADCTVNTRKLFTRKRTFKSHSIDAPTSAGLFIVKSRMLRGISSEFHGQRLALQIPINRSASIRSRFIENGEIWSSHGVVDRKSA